FCRKERIELIVVNMPITTYNIHLLSPRKYMDYVARLKQCAAGQNVTLYDMCTPSNYANSDFHDSVHLNAYGGKKFFHQLVNALSSAKRTSLAFMLAGKDLERHIASHDSPPAMQ